ncbi:hypothetical protein ACFYRC_36840 [Streptomyces sp. NPDC005279]|uniref:hypothetical protein n=1 Tax=Streptomyces sp. NPDC005279 TaxID=3364712 RepID=UPI0036A5CCAE
MLLPHKLAHDAAVATRWSATFPCCDATIDFDFLRYVNVEKWGDFRVLLEERALDAVVCECGASHIFTATVIVEVPRKNLLIYVTHGGDGPHVESCFRQDFEGVKEVAGRRPYTFVHGWNGLEAMLDIFDGDRPDHRAPPYPHAVDGREELHTLFGYIHGDLIFFDAPHVAVAPTVNALLEFATSLADPGDITRMIAIVEGFVRFTGPIHPWIVQELGSLNLRLGDLDAAEGWLTHAARLEHRWLAATRSFTDATPTRRAGFDAPSADLPHCRPASALGDITRNRHIVNGCQPALGDYGLWYFPTMQQAATPRVYSHQNALTAQGYVHGALDRAVRDEQWLTPPGTGDLVILTIRMMMLIDQLDRTPSLAEFARYYFRSYIIGRWNEVIGPDGSPVRESMVALLAEITERTGGAEWVRPAEGLGQVDMAQFFLQRSAMELTASLRSG